MKSHENRPGWLARIGLKACVVIVALFSITYVPYLLLGLWNRVFGGWTSVFYCYAGSTQFIDTYAPGFLIRTLRWFPIPIGILHNDGSRGIVIASPVTEEHFLDPENAAEFKTLQRRIRFIARLVGVSRISLSGILPSVVRDHGILSIPDGRKTVQRAVSAAVQRIVAEQFAGQNPPVIILGGAGHIGVPITAALQAKGMQAHVIDPKSGETRLPNSLKDRPCILLDCSRNGVIERYVEQMWPGMVLLNEVFPRTPRRVVDALTRKGIACWHLSGLAGSIFPPLPHGYENAIPCCAAHDVPEDPGVVLVQLNRDVETARSRPGTLEAA